MTYCVGLLLEEGVVLLADTRTNAGFDNIATFSKLKIFAHAPGHVLGLMSAGNLALAQAVTERLVSGLPRPGRAGETIEAAPDMHAAARLVGEAIRAVHEEHAAGLAAQNVAFDLSFILGGQIGEAPPRLFQVYAAGNFIEATSDTPFLQIGEHKYGKPILDRVASPALSLSAGIKLALLSMDATMRSNLSVGLPADLAALRRGSGVADRVVRIEEDDRYFLALRRHWSNALRAAYDAAPDPPWLGASG